jgi:hypothetical protein
MLSSKTTPSMAFSICSCRKFRTCAAMLRSAATSDKMPTRAAKQREPGRAPSLCPLSRTMDRLRTTRLKRAWKAREARMGREEDVVAIVDALGRNFVFGVLGMSWIVVENRRGEGKEDEVSVE